MPTRSPIRHDEDGMLLEIQLTLSPRYFHANKEECDEDRSVDPERWVADKLKQVSLWHNFGLTRTGVFPGRRIVSDKEVVGIRCK